MNKNFKLLTGIVATLSLVASIGTTVLAAGTAEVKPSAEKEVTQKESSISDEMRKAIHSAMTESKKTALNTLVKSGKITAEQMAKILAYDKEIFKSLNDEQKTALKAAMKEARKEALTKLVKNGTITQDQADRIQIIEKRGRKGMKDKENLPKTPQS